ncbi:hypothetical protein HUS23_14200 [Ectothiorhodospiraceae bacterium 2226]|nr:hypothetical protein HUS23_14200 [Ectothiorhodospiraceae bacterium 2226]
MTDWNTVATVVGPQYRRVRALLAHFGAASTSDYLNVLLVRVADIPAFLDALADELAARPDAAASVSRVVPLTHTFDFQTPEAFEQVADLAVREWLPQLRGARFHVRMHRRGFKGRLSSQAEEQRLDALLMAALQPDDGGARISFDDPDFIIAVETVGQRGGASCWSREQRARYPFLKLD